MPKQNAEDNRTLQDDRAELAADPEEDSPLAEGRGAPLAQDDVPEPERPLLTQGLLGGAPVAISDEDLRETPSSGGMTAAPDRPIND